MPTPITAGYPMNWTHLTAFHAVAETGGMTAGAERLGVSQPAVSRHVKDLEAALGVALFDRVGRGLRLTREGEFLAEYARRIFALAGEAERGVAELRAASSGRLAVGASTTIGAYLLPATLVAFRRVHPGVRVSVEVMNTDWVHRLLRDHAIDLGLTEGFVERDDLVGERFAEDELVAIAAPAHPLAARKRVSPKTLAAQPFLLREHGSGTLAVEEQALAALGLAIEPAMTLGSTEAIKRFVAAGDAVAIVSRLAVAAEVDAGTLAVVPVEGLKIPRPLHLVRHRDRSDGPAVKAFLEVLANRH